LRQLWPKKTFDEEQEIALLEKDRVFYARENKKIIGFISLTHKGGIARVKRLVVDQNTRRKGVGSRLLRRGVSFAKKSGCWIIWLNTGLSRKAARHFYIKNGFTQILMFTAIFIKIIG
jgi:GNAT superfamily N-acetyltransferase